MPRTRVVLGFEPNSLVPKVLYAGADGDLAEKSMKEAPVHLQRFEIFEGPGRRKNNARFDPSAPTVTVKASVFLEVGNDSGGEAPSGKPDLELKYQVPVEVTSAASGFDESTTLEVDPAASAESEAESVTEGEQSGEPPAAAEDPAPRGRRSRS